MAATAASSVAARRLVIAGLARLSSGSGSASGGGSSFGASARSSGLAAGALGVLGAAGAFAVGSCGSHSSNSSSNNNDNSSSSDPRTAAPLSALLSSLRRTTHCEEAAPLPAGSSRIQRKMTAIGHFSVASETVMNPSIITFVMNLRGDGDAPPLTRRDFLQLWRDRQFAARHPRFHQTVTRTERGGRLQFADEGGDTTIDSHVSETAMPANRFDLRHRLQQLQLDRWDLSDSLWHVWIASRTSPSWSLPSKYDTTNNNNDTNTSTANAKNKNQTMLLFRGHHALADGASMGAALTDLFDESFVLRDMTVQFLQQQQRQRRRRRQKLSVWQRCWRQLRRWLQFLVGALQAVLHQSWLHLHHWWDRDPWQQVRLEFLANSHGNNTNKQAEEETPAPRTLAWSDVASVAQVKWVAETLSRSKNDNASGPKSGGGDDDGTPSEKNNNKAITINDVFVSCVTAALAKQLQFHRQRRQALSAPDYDAKSTTTTTTQQTLLPRQKHVHVAIPVHLKGGVVLPDESVGNNIGAFVIRVPGEMDDNNNNNNNNSSSDPSVARLQAVSRELHAIKRTPAAFLSHVLAKGLSYASAYLLPVSWTSKLYAASNAGSLVVVSNNRGAPMPVHVKGRPVESLFGFVPLPPGVPVGVTVMSYAGNLNCTVAAEPWAVPDGDQFLVWVMEEYLRLVEAAKKRANANE